MGVFNAIMEIGDPAGLEFVALDGSVDTASTHTAAPEGLLNSLRVVAENSSRFELDDGRIVEYPVGNGAVLERYVGARAGELAGVGV